MDTVFQKFGSVGKQLVFWNILAFVFVKFIFSASTLQLAQIGTIPLFDSREVIALTNKARSDAGLAPLQANYKLDTAAQEKFNDMAAKGYFAHVSPDGVTPWFWIKDTAYKYIYAGENLAVGFSTANDTVTAWLNSPSHRANILNKNYKEIGIAVGRANVGGVNGILVVQMFGNQGAVVALSPTSSPAPVLSRVPVPTRTAVVVASPISAGAAVTPNKEEPVKLSYISTDAAIAPINSPQSVNFQNGKVVETLSSLFNNVYLVLAFALAMLSVLFALFYDRSRSGWLTATMQVAILVLAITVPSFGATLQGWVF